MEIKIRENQALYIFCVIIIIKKRHSAHTIYTIYTQYLVMVILLQPDKTELYKMRVAVCKWQWRITFDTKLVLGMDNVRFLFRLFLPAGLMKTVSRGRRAAVPLLMLGSERRLWSQRTPSSPFARHTRRWRSRPRWTERPRRRSPPGCPRCPPLWSLCSASAGCRSVASRRCRCERGTVDSESPHFTHGFTLWLIAEDGSVQARAITASTMSLCDWH